jgi:hypothetical protein
MGGGGLGEGKYITIHYGTVRYKTVPLHNDTLQNGTVRYKMVSFHNSKALQAGTWYQTVQNGTVT